MKSFIFILFILVSCHPFREAPKNKLNVSREIASRQTDKFLNLKFFGGIVYSIISDNKGGLFIAGNFDKVADINGTVKARKVVHIHPNGLINRRFKVNFRDYHSKVQTMLLDGDYLYLGGDFKNINKKEIKNIVRVHFNGKHDKKWLPQIDVELNKIIKKHNDLYIFGNEKNKPFVGKMNIETNKIEKTLSFSDEVGSIEDAILLEDQFYIAGNFQFELHGKKANHLVGIDSDFNKIIWNPEIKYSTGKPIVKKLLFEPQNKKLFAVGRFNYVDKSLRVNAVAFRKENQIELDQQFTPLGFNNSIESIGINSDLSMIFLGGNFTIANRDLQKGFIAYDYKTMQPIPREKFKAVVDYNLGDPQVKVIYPWGNYVVFGGQFSSVNGISGPFFNLYDLNSCQKCMF
jgi:hypothetical protein